MAIYMIINEPLRIKYTRSSRKGPYNNRTNMREDKRTGSRLSSTSSSSNDWRLQRSGRKNLKYYI